jgi:hypothetical protein
MQTSVPRKKELGVAYAKASKDGDEAIWIPIKGEEDGSQLQKQT